MTKYLLVTWLLVNLCLTVPIFGNGERLSDFTLLTIQGDSLSFSSYTAGKIAILWMTNLCETCQEEIESLEHIHRNFQNQVAVVAISILGNDVITPKKIQHKYKFSFPLLLDPEDVVGKKLGYKHYFGLCPFKNTLVIDRNGEIVFEEHLSAISNEEFWEVIKPLISNIRSSSSLSE